MSLSSPTRQQIGIVLTVTMVLLSGCGGLFGGEEQTPTATPSPTPDTPTPTPDNSSGGSEPSVNNSTQVQLPPGITGNGVNATRLTAVHAQSVLESGGFTANFSESFASAESTTVRNITMSVDMDESRALSHVTENNQTMVYYVGGDAVYVKNETSQEPTYSTGSPPKAVQDMLTGTIIREIFSTGEFTVAGTKPATNITTEEQLVVLQANKADLDEINVKPLNYNGLAIVGESGRVYYASYTVTWEDGRTVRTLSVTAEYYGFGSTTVPTPEWVSAVENSDS
ncbi:DUF7537 family lipoprotein [Salinibaculum rarum]|uniref:DUF7537 family lipoprotein n=1 Tax=Salinibaculum rarum TaxID=3058903 RepID=UPI00265FC58A|nr:hypothetical protein [Salinibaculum sp. KK48]